MLLRRSFASLLPTRNPLFGKLTGPMINELKQLVPSPAGVLTEADDMAPYTRDWMDKYGPTAAEAAARSVVVVRPGSTAEVSAVLRFCTEHRLAVVPQGGNTGLVGGSVPVHDELVLQLGRMNRVDRFDEQSGTLTCEAGCVLQTLDEHVQTLGYTMPLDLGAKGSCQIGGNVSTNAGGIRLLRYGSLHGSVLGLEVVLADGRVLDLLSPCRKDNTGYDLKHLFIGAEGTLGVVTRVALLTAPAPLAVGVALVACDSFAAAVRTLQGARSQVGEVLSAFEFMDRAALNVSLTHLPGARDPLPDCQAPFYCLLETRGADRSHDEAKLHAFLERAMEAGDVVDGTVAESDGQVQDLWRLREELPTAQQQAGRFYKYDLSLPLDAFYSIVDEMKTRLAHLPECQVIGYGHLGDANLHLNVLVPELNDKYLSIIEPFAYEFVAGHNGSISAEHGIGLMKANYLHYSKSTDARGLMRQMKQMFDPAGILNPYKVLN